MAHLGHPLQKRPNTPNERLDRELHLALADWEDLRNLPDELNLWSEDEHSLATDLIVEWPLVANRFSALRTLADEGRLTTEQRADYADLENLVARNKPKLERLARSPLPLNL